MTPARFAAIWADRGPQNTVRLTPEEDAQVTAHWRTLDGATCWMDAFHALWRLTDPEGHRARFARTFYESAESMAAEDDDKDDDKDGAL